jgi:hypothetical protein
MKYSEAKELLPSADFIYFDVTSEETDLAKDYRYIAYDQNNKILLGSGHPIEELVGKLLVEPERIPGSMDFGVPSDAVEIPTEQVITEPSDTPVEEVVQP